MVRMRPRFCACIFGAIMRVTSRVPMQLIVMMSRISFSEVRVNGTGYE